MTHFTASPDYQEAFEYHGNTAIEWTRLQNGSVEKEWLLFDSVEEAASYFHEECVGS
jgi:hypothetical protein